MEYNIAILISGRGSNMLNIIRASKNKEIKSKIITVISQNPNAAGLQKAEREKKGVDETSSSSSLVPSGKWAGSRGQIVKILKS